jgi:hypothetical protein
VPETGQSPTKLDKWAGRHSEGLHDNDNPRCYEGTCGHDATLNEWGRELLAEYGVRL